MKYIDEFLQNQIMVLEKLDKKCIQLIIQKLATVRRRAGRLFIIGVGGSAANASHAVNDFRKLCGIETYAPTDNVSELTARTNDEGWATVFVEWLRVSRLNDKDCLLILSVGGGDAERNISKNIVLAIDYAKSVGAMVLGIVGRDGGYTARQADAFLLVPTLNVNMVTPLAEATQAIIWHLLVTHPELRMTDGKWEQAQKI